METKIYWTIEQKEAIDDCRRTVSEVALTLESLSWLFEPNSNEEKLLMEQVKKAEEIEIFCEEQLNN